MKSGDFNLFEHLVKPAEFPQVLNWLGSATRCALVGTSLQMNIPGNRSISDEALSLLQASLSRQMDVVDELSQHGHSVAGAWPFGLWHEAAGHTNPLPVPPPCL